MQHAAGSQRATWTLSLATTATGLVQFGEMSYSWDCGGDHAPAASVKKDPIYSV